MNPIHPLWLVAIAWASSICAVPAMAQPASVQAALHRHSLVMAPATHQQVSQRSVSVDGVSASLTRYERRDGRNTGLGGEHFSTLIAADGTLKGFIHLSLDVAGKPLPSRERSEQVARQFLREAAPDLLPRMRITSIAPHHEPVRSVRNGRRETMQIAGMRLKARNTADGSWLWIVVGSDEKPMLFERDLQWSNLRFRRTTEQWLYDRWRQRR